MCMQAHTPPKLFLIEWICYTEGEQNTWIPHLLLHVGPVNPSKCWEFGRNDLICSSKNPVDKSLPLPSPHQPPILKGSSVQLLWKSLQDCSAAFLHGKGSICLTIMSSSHHSSVPTSPCWGLGLNQDIALVYYCIMLVLCFQFLVYVHYVVWDHCFILQLRNRQHISVELERILSK